MGKPTKRFDIDRYELHGYGVTEKEVKKSGQSGCVYVPKEWIGCRVEVVLKDIPNTR